MSAPRWIIAGGGTGGHLYPGLAVAEALARLRPSAEVLFVGTANGIEARVVPAAGRRLATIDVEGVKNRGAGALFKAAYQVPKSIGQSLRILAEFKPTAVLGVGGYAGGPMLMAAWLKRLPTFIQEQNAYPGITNRILSRFVRGIFTSLPGTQGFPEAKVKLVGNPIRASIRPGTSPAKFTLLVFGGSQGSRAINRALAEAAPLLADRNDRLRVIHQQGRDTAVDVAGAYRAAGIDADVRTYFDDMPEQYAQASLAVCRAGATSLAELAAAGLPAVLLPFPFAADNHQEKNADVVAAAGAAVKLRDADASGARMAELIRAFMDQPAKREATAAAMRGLARPQAAEDLVRAVLAATENTHV